MSHGQLNVHTKKNYDVALCARRAVASYSRQSVLHIRPSKNQIMAQAPSCGYCGSFFFFTRDLRFLLCVKELLFPNDDVHEGRQHDAQTPCTPRYAALLLRCP